MQNMQNKFFPTNSVMDKSSIFFTLVKLFKTNKNMEKPKNPLSIHKTTIQLSDFPEFQFTTYNFASSAIFNKSGLLSNAPDRINCINAFSLSSIGVVCSVDINIDVTFSKIRLSGIIKLPSCCQRTINA